MTEDEKQIMTLSIKNAMLEGFEAFAKTMNENIDKGIELHRQNCRYVPSVSETGISINWIIKNWQKVAVAMVIMTWLISTTISAIKGTPNKFTVEQVKQIGQQVQEVTNPVPVVNSTNDKENKIGK